MASRSLGTLTLDLVARIFGFRQGMDQAARVAEERSRRINRSIANISRSFGNLIGVFSAGLLARSIIRATKEAEFAVAQLDAVVKSTGGAAGFTTPQLVEMSEALRDVTIFSDEAVQGMEGVLLSFTSITGPTFERTLELVADVSTALGRDLSSSAIIVGRALNNPVRGMNALSRAGIVFSEAQRKVIKDLVTTGNIAKAQTLILNELEIRFGGSARAARETFGGALEGLKNTASDLLEAKGRLPEMVESINELTEALQDPQLKAGLDVLVSGLTRAFAASVGGVGIFASAWQNMIEGIAAFGGGAAIGDLVRLEEEQYRLKLAYNKAIDEGNQKRADAFDQELQEVNKRLEITREEIKITGKHTDAQMRARGQLKQDEEDAAESAAKQVAALEKQVALFGKTGKAAEVRYDIEHGAYDLLKDEDQDRILALSSILDILEKHKDLVGALSTSQIMLLESENTTLEQQKQLREEILALALESGRVAREELGPEIERQESVLQNTPLVQGDVTQDDSGGGFDSLSEAVENVGESAENLIPKFEYTLDAISIEAEQAARNFQSAFADFLFDPFEDGLEGMLKGFIDILRRMVAEIAAAQIIEQLGGTQGIGSWLGGLFSFGSAAAGASTGRWDPSASFASGGYAPAGTMAMVGEEGPEAVLFGSAANIIPNDKLGGITINQAFDQRGASVDFIKAFPKLMEENNRRLMEVLQEAPSRGRRL